MKDTVRLTTTRKAAAKRRLEAHLAGFKDQLQRLQEALEGDKEVDITFLQHTAFFSEAAGTYNALHDVLLMLAAEKS